VTAAAAKWWLAGGVSASNAVAAYQPKGAASYAASKVNLANPGTYDATEGAAPTWAAATGWTFPFPANKYLLCGAGWSGTYSALVRFANGGSTSPGSVIIGGPYPSLGLFTNYFGLHAYRNGTSERSLGSSQTAGVMAVAGAKGYLNGTSEVANLDGTGSHATIYIGQTGPNNSYWFGDILAVAFYNTTLSAAQVAAVTTAMQAL
jgi:hypothetical protein